MKPTVQARVESRTSLAHHCALAATLLIAVVICRPVLAQETKEVGKSGDWTLYNHAGPSPMCFLASRARESEPKGQRRAGHFYITSWPKDDVKQEISISLGTALKTPSQVEVAIGSNKFKFFAQGDKAFVSSSPDESKLLTALKKGNMVTVVATSASGASLTDKYSLIGISQGIQNLANDCK